MCLINSCSGTIGTKSAKPTSVGVFLMVHLPWLIGFVRAERLRLDPAPLLRSLGVSIETGLVAVAILVKIGGDGPGVIAQDINRNAVVINRLNIRFGSAGLDVGEFYHIKRAGFFEFEFSCQIGRASC